MSFEYSTLAITKWNLDDLLEIIDTFENVFSDAVHHKLTIKKDYNTILLHIAGKTLVTTRELVTLCAHGYSDGALSLGRNLYEQLMIVFFLEMHKNDSDFQDYVDDFFLSYEVQRNKCLRNIDKYIPDGNISNLNDEFEELKKRAKRKITNDYWWTGCATFSDLVSCVMADQTDPKLRIFFGKHYATYKRACISLHAGCMGNSIRIGSDAESNVVDTSPSMYGQSTPLVFAVTSLIGLIGTICSNFNIDGEYCLNGLNKLLLDYQQREKEDKKV